MTVEDEFQTAAAGRGLWPTAPDDWSYSSLIEAEACPRRWSLARATYPDVWERSGYPRRSHIAALAGDVIHGALEDFVAALRAERTATEPGAAAFAALRRLGGYTALVQRGIGAQETKLQTNPRMAPRAEHLRAQLERRAPEMRQRVQSMVARLQLGEVRTPEADGGGGRGQLAVGLHPEVDLHAPALRFKGRADLVAVKDEGVTITDYKTGQADPEHHDQLLIYALLWQRDKERNPDGTPAATLAIAYASHDEVFGAPDQTALDEVADALSARIADVETDLTLRPPPARPSPETCRHCAVRHLCDEYWLDPALPDIANSTHAFRDLAGTVSQRNGPRSWVLSLDSPPGRVLLRTPTEEPGFNSGDRVRLLDVAYGADDDAEQVVATITQGSEAFVLTA